MNNAQRFISFLTWVSVMSLAQQAVVAESGNDGYVVHYRPADHALGDVHPYFHDGKCYLFYLRPKTYQVALVVSEDLMHWEPQGLVFDSNGSNVPYPPYFVLGVLRDPATGLFRSYCGSRSSMRGTWSQDLIHWHAAPETETIPVWPDASRRRDPCLFWDEASKQYGCAMTTRMVGLPDERAGAVTLAVSRNLAEWNEIGPLVFPRDIGEPECPQLFQLGDRWYLLASVYDRAVGQPVYWSSRDLLSGWQSKPDDVLDGKDLCAAQVTWTGQEWLLMGWIPDRASRPGDQAWGGHLALPRQIECDSESGGLLTAKLADRVDRMLRKQRRDLTGYHAKQTSDQTGIEASWDVERSNLDLELNGIAVHRGPSQKPLRIHWFDQQGVRQATWIWEATTQSMRIEDGEGEVWSERTCANRSDSALSSRTRETQGIRLIIDQDIVEAFFAGKFSLAARLPKPIKASRVRIEQLNEAMELDNLTIHSIGNNGSD